MGNISNFFNSSKVIFSGLQENLPAVVADVPVELFYQAQDYITEGSFTIVSTSIISKVPRAATTILPTVVTVATDPGVTKDFSTTILGTPTSTSSFILSFADELKIGDSITVGLLTGAETVLVIGLDGNLVATAPLTAIPAEGDVVTYSTLVVRANTYKVSFTIAAADLKTDLYLKFNITDYLGQGQVVLTELPKP